MLSQKEAEFFLHLAPIFSGSHLYYLLRAVVNVAVIAFNLTKGF